MRLAVLITLAAPLMVVATAGPASATTTPQDRCKQLIPFDRKHFGHSTDIDNKWFPLIPGTQYTFEGRSNLGGGVLPHQVIFTITDATKVINGVKTVVLWDRDLHEGQLVEEELAFFAQDKADNVWSMGEYPEELENGAVVGAPNTWIPGQDGAKAGIMMRAHPKLGMLSYRQGFSPEIDFYDCGKVSRTGVKDCVPVGCYNNLLVIREWSPLDPEGGFQFKYHAAGVGVVKIEAVDDPQGETLVLTKVVKLGKTARQQAHARVLQLDKRAYQVAPDVYGDTPRAK